MLLPIQHSVISPYLSTSWLSLTPTVSPLFYPAILGTNNPLTLTWGLTPSHFLLIFLLASIVMTFWLCAFMYIATSLSSHHTFLCGALVLHDLLLSLLCRFDLLLGVELLRSIKLLGCFNIVSCVFHQFHSVHSTLKHLAIMPAYNLSLLMSI